jgi:SAM-dependent methyltransferase
LEHLDNLTFSLKEIHRVLKKDGYFLTSVMTDRWEDYLFGKKIFGNAYLNFMRKKQIHQNLLSINQWKKVFQSVGFKIIKIQGYLNKEQSQWIDILHYFSLPSLLSYVFFKKWVLLPHWYKIIKFDQPIENLVDKKPIINQSAACFFVLKK